MNKNDFYAAAYIAVFGVLWGAVEILLGNVLHLFSVPFKGTILSAIGCIICLVGSSLIPGKKSLAILYIGIIAILIKLFSFGIFKPHIFFSMFLETVLLQIIISILRYNLLSFIISGIAACLAPYLSAALFFGIIFGKGTDFIQHGLIADSAHMSWLVASFTYALLLILLLSIFVGILTGISAFYFRKKLTNVISS